MAGPAVRSRGLFVSAGLLIAAYGVVEYASGFFAVRNYHYMPFLENVLFSLPSALLASILWKVLLLLPAAVLIALGLGRAGFRPRLVAPGGEVRALGALSVCAAVALVAMAAWVYGGTEITDDENVYDFQAKTLLLGRLSNPPPPGRECFDNVFIINDGVHWTGKYTPGHPLVVAAGMALGSPYAVTLLLSVATVLLLYGVVAQLYGDRRLALLTACLGFVSPFFYFVSATRLSHTTAAFFLALFFWLFLKGRGRAGGGWQMFGAGLAMGYAFNVRPLTALGFGLPFVAVLVFDLWKRREGGWSRFRACLGGFLVLSAGTLAYNAFITGDPFTFPFNYYDPSERLGFGVRGHTVWKGLYNLGVSALRVNAFLFGFPVSLLFAAGLLFFRRVEGDRLNFAIVGSVALLFFFYFFPGVSDAGPVYYYELLLPLLMLSARGMVEVHRWLGGRSGEWRAFVPNVVLVSVVLAAFTFVPERVVHIRGLTAEVRRAYAAVEEAGVSNAVVMVASMPEKGWVFGYRNPWPDFRDDVVYCRYADSAANLAVARRFAGRSFYLLWGGRGSAPPVLQPMAEKDFSALPAMPEPAVGP